MGDARYSIITGVWYYDSIEIPAIVKAAWKKEDEKLPTAPRTSSKNVGRKRKRSSSPSYSTSKRAKYVHDAELKTLRITPRRQSTPKKIKSVVIKPKPPTELADSKAKVTEKPMLKKAAEEVTEKLQQNHCVTSMDEFLLDFSYIDTLTDINFL